MGAEVRIYLRDHDWKKSGWLEELSTWNGFEKTGSYVPEIPPFPEQSATTSNVVVFVHAEEAVWRKWTTAFSTGDSRHLVRISTRGIHAALDPTDDLNVTNCWWKPKDFSKVPEAQEFKQRLELGEFRADLLRPIGTPPMIAAYLLAKHFALRESDTFKEAAHAEYVERVKLSSMNPYKDCFTEPTDEEMMALLKELSSL